MPSLFIKECFSRFQKMGRNSSHLVWFLTDLEYYETKNEWVFAFRKIGKVTLIALEPLIPGAPQEYSAADIENFQIAWAEFCDVVKPQISAFVGIYAAFSRLLAERGFQTVQVGQEPWVDLKDCIPTGKSGKGVRAGRNQALRAGFTVVEWSAADIQKNHGKREQMEKILKGWKGARPIDMSGFLNAVDPFQCMHVRRYFVLLSSLGELLAFLVASPVPGINSYFLEDMILCKHPPRGIGELLTLEALVALGETGGTRASLGVVSMTTLDPSSAVGIPKLIRHLLITVPNILGKIMNVEGLQTFRRRFKPAFWESIHVAVENRSSSSDTWAWLTVLFSMLIAWRPRIQITPKMIFEKISGVIQEHALTVFFAVLTFSIYFGLNNADGSLPDWALQRFGFYGSAPWHEWPVRSLVSDLLYFDHLHFWVINTILLVLVFITEKLYGLVFASVLIALVSVFDDPLHYLCVIKPFEHFHPALFERLIAYKDVGSSLLVTFLVGMHLQVFRRIASIVFAVMVIGFVLELLFVNERHYAVVLNINHFFFFCLGFIAGKAKVEYDLYREREVSRKVSRAKPPEAKSVRSS